jgi:hypothetical protein
LERRKVSFQQVNAEQWQAEKMFAWQRRVIEKLAEERKIRWENLLLLMNDWVGRWGFDGMTRKEGSEVANKLREIPISYSMQIAGAIVKRAVGKVKVREF